MSFERNLQKLQERTDSLEQGLPSKLPRSRTTGLSPASDDLNKGSAPSTLVILDPPTSTPAPVNTQSTAVAALSQQVIRRPYLDGTRLDAFHGREDENLQLWLKKFYLHLKRCQIDENTEQAVWELVAHLKGPAESWYYSLPNDVAGSLQSMEEALLKRYGAYDRKWKLWQEMDSIKQITSLSFERYIEDINNLCHRVGADDETKLRCFVRGLEPKLRIAVASREPTTYQEAERAARLHVALQKGEEKQSSDGGFSLKEIGENIGREIMKNIQPQPVAAYYGNHNESLPHSLQPLNYQSGRNQNHRRESSSQRAPPWYQQDGPNRPHDAPLQPYPHGIYQAPMPHGHIREWQKDGQTGGNQSNKLMTDVTRCLSDVAKAFNQLNAPPQAPVARNRRTADGRPICNYCHKAGHLAINCNKRNQQALSNRGEGSGRVAAITDSPENEDEAVACIGGETDTLSSQQPRDFPEIGLPTNTETENTGEAMCAVDHISVTPDLFAP
ncbi:uncharacterized protein LOC110245716 [Exaiptasia diaphana]|uniref:Ty3 transposon capsid-like protein domain-containing protein n=1 Tax=Exaiptasia diaphana TaxID=2652724 RepID=A0A913XPN9_EXADI|nr:uncharacterized protein LOC110245716 [Exaiptasia diaphana]